MSRASASTSERAAARSGRAPTRVSHGARSRLTCRRSGRSRRIPSRPDGVATVILPRSLVALFPGAERRHEVDGATVGELIERLDERVPGLRNRVVDAGPVIREHLNVFVAGERATLATTVPA